MISLQTPVKPSPGETNCIGLFGKNDGENKRPRPALWLDQHLNKWWRRRWKYYRPPWSWQWRRWLGRQKFVNRRGRRSRLPRPDRSKDEQHVWTNLRLIHVSKYIYWPILTQPISQNTSQRRYCNISSQILYKAWRWKLMIFWSYLSAGTAIKKTW